MMTYYWLNKNSQRYYKIVIGKDLLNDLVLTYIWGGVHSRRGRHKNIVMESKEEIELQLNNMLKRRSKRGYELIATKVAHYE